MRVEIRIEKRSIFFLVGVLFLLATGAMVYAYGTTNPATFGHTFNELMPPDNCLNGQFLKLNGQVGQGWSWTCGSSSGGAGTSTITSYYIVTAGSGLPGTQVMVTQDIGAHDFCSVGTVRHRSSTWTSGHTYFECAALVPGTVGGSWTARVDGNNMDCAINCFDFP